jgi:hypothetical protein
VSVWYPSIDEVRKIVVSEHKADAEPQVRQIAQVLKTQAVPLLTASFLTTCLLLPKAIGVLRGTVDALADRGGAAVSDYNAVEATFVLVVTLIALLALQSLSWTLELDRKRRSAPK